MTQAPILVGITVTLPRDLVREIDELVGRQHRNEFLNAALREKVSRIRLAQ